MEIHVVQPSIYFTLFYLLAFAFLVASLLLIGRKKGYSIEKLLLLIGAVSLGTILGSRLATIPFNEWGSLLFTSEVPFLNRAASGGIIAGLLCLFWANRVLKFAPNFLIHFAWIVPIGLSIQKMGCFLNGCCYGTPTSAVWGTLYPQNTQPHYNHWLHDQIDISSPWSLSVHPVQLYEIIAMILMAGIVWHTRHYWRRTWSTLLFGLSLIFSARFITEFFRDSFGSQFGTEEWIGLRYIQWAFLITVIVLGSLVWLNEKDSGNQYRKKLLFSFKRPFKELEFAALLSLITFSFQGLFTSYEWIALWITLIPAIVLFVLRKIHENNLGSLRWWALTAFLIPVWLIAQTMETITYKDSTAIKKETFHRIDVGANLGSFYNLLRSNPNTTNTECGSSTSYTYTPVKSDYSAWGAGYSKVQRKGIKETKWGVNGYFGSINSSLVDTTGTFTNEMWGINPYVKYEGKWYGVGVGLHAGRLYLNKEQEPIVDDLDQLVESKPILPEVYLRLGVRKYLDVDYNYGFLFPSPYPTTYSRVSVGSGLWQDHDYSLRYGKFFPMNSQFISAEGLITKNLGVQFMYIFKDNYSFTLPELPDNDSNKFVVSLNYRFGHQ
jgi:prolipoprotein diacylglyceryltransferase